MKIKAFTILEMIINLALMSIIISMVYVVYSYFSKNLQEYSLMSTENFEIASFDTMLKEDFFYADKIVSTNDKDIKFIFYNETFVVYKSNGKYIYRIDGNKRDSIPFKGMDTEYLYPDSLKNEESLIKNMLITTELYGKNIPLFGYKNYFSNY